MPVPVSYLDLLGFSQIIEQFSLDEIEQRYTQTLMSGLAFAGFSSIGAFVFDEEGNLDMGQDLWSVSFGIFSDTVVLYPRPLVDRPFKVICKVVALLIDIALQGDWLFRGGIDFGTFRFIPEYNVYLGKGIVGAHQLEKSQNWAGAIVSERAQTKFARDVTEMKEEHLLVEYPVPVKTKTGVIAKKRLAINWCYFDMKWQEHRRNKLKAILDAAPKSARGKVQSTIDFHDNMVKAGYASIRQIEGKVYGNPIGGTA